ncbi:MAG: sugar phosphate isomerase/epimerase [Christensenellaceae bacterium]|nr:sugar phosphate isomerase/epimerase [Christensenellaceae bacterium]
MRLGFNWTPEHRSPEDWAEMLSGFGLKSCVFPVSFDADIKLIDRYVKAANDHDLIIAECGVWNSPHITDPTLAKKAKEDLVRGLELADYVKAECCVNISGAAGPVWNECYRENYSPELYDRNVELVRYLIDTVKPKNTYYALEVMQWMLPDSPEQYVQFIRDVDRERFAVHMDAVNFVKDPYIYTHSGELVRKAYSLLGDKIKSVHLKDCRIEPALSFIVHEVLPGIGEFDLDAYVEETDKLGPDIPVLFEHLDGLTEFLKALSYVKEKYKDRIV